MEVTDIVYIQKKEYPVIKENQAGSIVLFTGKNEGVCLEKGNAIHCYVGKYSSSWDESSFIRTILQLTIKF